MGRGETNIGTKIGTEIGTNGSGRDKETTWEHKKGQS